MKNIARLEEYYKKYIRNLHEWIPEGIQIVNLNMLQKMDLLHFKNLENKDPAIMRYFQLVESPEKITLVNDEFVIWIVTDNLATTPLTYTLIALKQGEELKLELAFIASGVYNSSNLILRILEKFLIEIQENERTLSKLSNLNI